MASQHITKCISYEFGIVKNDLFRNGELEKVDYLCFADPDTSEEWYFLADTPDKRITMIEKLAEDLAGADRTKLIQALSKVEIHTLIPPGGTQ